MRHRKTTVKLGRSSAPRDSMLANQVCSLILHERIKTTLAKAKAARPLAEKMVTLGKEGTVHARRLATAELKQKDVVKKLFADIAPRSANRQGGYTRIIKLGPRLSDAAPMAYLEWVDQDAPSTEETTASEPKAKKSSSRKETAPAAEKKAPAKAKKEKAESTEE